MPDLLLELLSEEIPARMQRRAAEDLRKLVTDALVERGFVYEGAKAFATPRRLALHVAGLPAKGQDVREERRGPRVGAPAKAVEGFLKSAGLASLDQAKIEKDPKKGEFYVAVIERPGRATPDVLAEILPAIIRDFPWPKSMRWGARSAEPGALRWVRPLHAIVCTFGPETEIPDVVPFAVDGIRAGDYTHGHRFMAPGLVQVRRFDDYMPSLERAKVVLDADRRKDIIRTEAQTLAFARGLELIEDEALLEEVAGLVEWPVVLMGSFDESFLDIPPEVIRATIRANQKCFVLRDVLPSPLRGGVGGGGRDELRSDKAEAQHSTSSAGTALSGPAHQAEPPPSPTLPRKGGESASRLSNHFILVSNLEARDGGAAIVAGNERVVRARLSDAKFFWETDLKTKLEDRLGKLKTIVFHEKLGTQYERVERIAALAHVISDLIEPQKQVGAREFGGDVEKYHQSVQLAAHLAKADLVTEMVGEFPELQGLMGRYYAEAQGKPPRVALAIEEHYKPLGPSDRVPTDPVSVAVALADKIDTLVGFWAIDEKPTGSKDPYALRRAALGVIRLVLENELRIPLQAVIRDVFAWQLAQDGYVLLTRLNIERGLWAQTNAKQFARERAAQFRYLTWGRDGEFWFDLFLERFGDQKAGARDSLRDSESLSVSKFLEEEPFRYGIEGFYQDEEDTGWPAKTADEAVLAIRRAAGRVLTLEALYQAAHRVGSIRFGWLTHEIRNSNTRGDISLLEAERFLNAEATSLLAFFADRLKVYLRDQGARHDLIDAVFALPGQDDLLMIVRRVEALGRFLDTEDGKNLLAGFKRAANILRIEEKKDSRSYDDMPDIAAFVQDEEKALALALAKASATASEEIAREDFEAAMRALAELRPSVDAFFDKVTVNADDPALRENRLKLLNMLRRATREVADFSRIEG